MPISGREFERAPVKDAFEWQVDRLLGSVYPDALSTREIHERLVGPLLDTAKLGQEWREYLRRINEAMLRLTDLRLAILQLRFGYPEFRFVSMPGGRVLKHWRGKKPDHPAPPKAAAPVPVRKPAARPASPPAAGASRSASAPANSRPNGGGTASARPATPTSRAAQRTSEASPQ